MLLPVFVNAWSSLFPFPKLVLSMDALVSHSSALSNSLQRLLLKRRCLHLRVRVREREREMMT